VHKGSLLTAVLVGLLTAGCSTSTTPDPTTTRPLTVITVTPSESEVSPPASAPPPGSSLAGNAAGLPIGQGPIPGATVDAVAGAWAKYWHASPVDTTVLGTRSTRLNVDFPAAHGKLFMAVARQGSSAAVTHLYCEITDKSRGPQQHVAMTRKNEQRLIAGCPGPVLNADERKQVADFVAKHDKPDALISCGVPGKTAKGQCWFSDHRIDLARFQLVVQTSPTQFRLNVLGRKGSA